MAAKHLKYDVATGHLLYTPDSGHLVYQCVYIADGDLTCPAATCSGSATFTEGDSGVGACTAPPATCSGSGSHTVPGYSGDGACTAPPATCSGSGSHFVADYLGDADCTAPPATCSGSASHTAKTYSADGDCTTGAATCSGNADFIDVGTAIGMCTMGAATCSGDAEQQGPSFEGDAACTAGAATCSGSASHAVKTYEGTGSLTAPEATCSASGSHTAKTYSASAAVTAGAVTCSGSAAHTVKTYNARVTLNVGAATCAGSASFTEPPPNTGTASLTTGKATCSGNASHVAKTYSATAALTAPEATCAASGTHQPKTYSATAALTAPKATCAASGEVTDTVVDWSLEWAGGFGQFSGNANHPDYEATFSTDPGAEDDDVIISATATAAQGYDITNPLIQYTGGSISQSTTLRESGRDAADGFGGHRINVCEHTIVSGGGTGLPTYNFHSVDPASDLGATVVFRIRRGAAAFVSQSSTVDGSPSATPGAPASITVNYPTGIQEGDLLVICLTYESDGDQYLPDATGFTGVNNELSSYGILVSLARAINSCILVRTATGSESGSVTVNAVGPGEAGFTWYGCQGFMLCYR